MSPSIPLIEIALKHLVEELRSAGCVFAEDEAALVFEHMRTIAISPVTEEGQALMGDYVRRRRAGEPAEYILGWAEFAGVRVAVGPGVFIPRRWSEGLLLRAVEILDVAGGGNAVDLGSGSGAIALAIHSRRPGSKVWATEASAVAARWAIANCAGRSGLTVCAGDLYDVLPRALERQVDVIVGSLPYVPSGELDRLPRDHLMTEPPAAFDGGPLGLAIVGRALADAHHWLRPAGCVLLEIGLGQGAAATAIATESGLKGIVIQRDEDGGELFLEACV